MDNMKDNYTFKRLSDYETPQAELVENEEYQELEISERIVKQELQEKQEKWNGVITT